MGKNPVFQVDPKNSTSEQILLDDLINESINMMGELVYYLPRSSRSTPDTIYGEDPVSLFSSAYLIPMYLDSFNGPSGPSEIFAKFGLSINDTHKYILARRAFQKAVPSTVRTRPLDGDLIYIPAFTDLMEIKFVEQEYKFYPLARRAPLFYFYELQVENFKFSNEWFRTGVIDIDTSILGYSYTIVLNLSSTSNTNLNFSIGETAFQANTGFTSVVKAWNPGTQVLQITDAVGILANSGPIHGNTSNAMYTVSGFDYQNFSGVNEVLADNLEIGAEAEAAIDSSTMDPFGSP